MCKHFPDEADVIQGFVQEMVNIAEETNSCHQRGRMHKRIFKIIFPIQYRKMWNVRHKTLDELMDEYVRDPALQNILAALWGYYGLPPSELSGFYYANATGDYLKNGSYYVKQRSQDLSSALADVIERFGGTIIYKTSAQKIVVKDGPLRG